MEVPQKTKNRTTIWSSNPTLKHISSKAKIQKDTYTSVFRAALFTTAKTWKRSRLPSTDEWIKMWCIYIKYTADYYLAVKKKDIMPLASPWTDLEIIGLSESERDKHHMVLTFMGNLKYDTNEPILQNRNRLTDRENTLVVAKGEEGGGGMDWEFQIRRCKLLCLGWINNKVLLYSTGNYIQYPVINHNGKEF